MTTFSNPLRPSWVDHPDNDLDYDRPPQTGQHTPADRSESSSPTLSLRPFVEAAIARAATPHASANDRFITGLAQGLTPSQFAACTHGGNPLLVLAGAGTGKTRVLTTRIALMIAAGITRGENILALTFTNKAAREMRARIDALLGADSQVTCATFHGFCAQQLRTFSLEAGLQPEWTILNADDALRELRKAWKATIDTPLDKAGNAALRRAYEDYGRQIPEFGERFVPEPFGSVIRAFEAAKSAANALDYADLVQRFLALLEENPAVRDELRARYQHLLIDEYQDTDALQERLASLIAGGREPVAVGDDDQLLYSWRGANISNILRFAERWHGTTIRLEENFRSTASILDLANRLISHNQNRLGKTLSAVHPHGHEIAWAGFHNAADEAEWTAEQVLGAIRGGTNPEHIAILARTGFALNLFESALTRRGIRYTLSGGTRFADRAEIKDISAWVRLIANASDRPAFARAIATPRRGIGPANLELIENAATQRRLDIIEAARRLAEAGTFNSAANAAVLEFVDVIRRLAADALFGLPADTLLERLVDESGYLAMLSADRRDALERRDIDEAAALEARISNLRDLVTIGEGMTLLPLLDHLGLTEDARRDDSKGVWLGTVHAAKGLEWPHVILAAFEQNILPSPFLVPEDIEEERRIAYVAFTRARERLTLTFALSRLGQDSGPSMFLADLGIVAPHQVPPLRRRRGSDSTAAPGAAGTAFAVDDADFDVPF